MSGIDAPAYLARIGYCGPTEPTLATLRALHAAHLLAVPFENLDIVAGRPLSLAREALFDKVVARRRGGFCFELNGIFAELLGALGFEVTLLAAEVARESGVWGPPFDHLALLVTLDEPWLADVGFGRASFREPLRLRERGPQEIAGARYLVVADGAEHRVRIEVDGEWKDMYRFTLEPRRLQEFEATCRYHQTSPESPFSSVRVCGLVTADGRVTLVGRTLRIVAGDAREERDLEGEESVAEALRERFGLVL